MTVRARVTAVSIAVGVALLVASGAYADVKEYIDMFSHVNLVMKDGATMHADIVKMNGHTYVMIPVDSLPDYLHQQVFKVMHHS
jgi:hypothetical protein